MGRSWSSTRTTPSASPASSSPARPDLDDILLAGRILVSLAAVLAVIWYAHRFAQKRGIRPGTADEIRIIGRQGLGAKAQLVVVEVDKARYVLGVTEAGVTVVDTLDAKPAPEPEPEPDADESDDDAHMGSMLNASPTPTAATFGALMTSAKDNGTGPLHGSILSPGTWRRAGVALRRVMSS